MEHVHIGLSTRLIIDLAKLDRATYNLMRQRPKTNCFNHYDNIKNVYGKSNNKL